MQKREKCRFSATESQLVYLGSDDTISRAFSIEPHDNTLFLPGVMSRKKQIIPMLTALWG